MRLSVESHKDPVIGKLQQNINRVLARIGFEFVGRVSTRTYSSEFPIVIPNPLPGPVTDVTLTYCRNLTDDTGPAWVEVGSTGAAAFENSWANFGGGYTTAAYMLHPDGTVEIKGTVQTGVPPTVVFTLPEGYRPAENFNFPTVSNNAFGYFVVGTDGKVTAQVGAAADFSIHCRFKAAATSPMGYEVDWIPDPEGIRIRNVKGLVAGKNYELRFVIYA